MAILMIFIGCVLLLCVFSSKLLYRFGIPALLIFLVLGMMFGSDGPGKIYFENYEFTEEIGTISLMFIMFYGGFGTNWKAARPVAAPSILLATAGVVITALLTGWFCCVILQMRLAEGFLIGAIVGSTDAASVFSILRSRKLNLKYGIASMLEVESGSNDPVAYMMTIIIITMMTGDSSTNIVLMAAAQIVFGMGIGFALAYVSKFILQKMNFEIEGLYTIYVVGMVVLGYALASLVGGNGYLTVYILGLVLGNTKLKYKRTLVHFFDGLSWMMQMVLFFVLGLLAYPSHFPAIAGSAILIALFLMFVARPASVFAILSFFKISFKEKVFVSWVGLRGAAAIVFAILAITEVDILRNDIFHIVFFIALLSVAVQGTLTPLFAKKLDLVEEGGSVFKTFTDYQDESELHLVEVVIDKDNPWQGKTLRVIDIPKGVLVVMIKRDGKNIVPDGSTVLLEGDTLVLSGNDFEKIPL